MVRAVLDTNVVVSACLAPEGAPSTIVELALLGTFTLYVSADVFAEYREVLARDKFSRQQERVKALLDGIEEVAVAVRPSRTITVSTDNEDNRLLDCAEAAQADFLVSGNPKHLPKSFGTSRIITPRDFL